MSTSELDQIIQIILIYVELVGQWVLDNLSRLLFSVAAIVIGYIIQWSLSKRINRLSEEKKLTVHMANVLQKLTQWGTGLVVLSIVFVQFGVTLAMISGFFTLLGGTIIGFAAINTLGNAIAGLIIMSSKPFRIGDRIYFNDRYSDVLSIDLIYTKLVTVDYVIVSVPNQSILMSEIENYGKKMVVRVGTSITAGYEEDSSFVSEVLLKASKEVESVIEAPKPYVWISAFKDYAVEYTLFVFIQDVKRILEIEAELREVVLRNCKKNDIDISTPTLIVAQATLREKRDMQPSD
jgi:small conductance mechanosensitive channel